MERCELIERILNSDILKKWHWLEEHFAPLRHGRETDIVNSLLDALEDLDNKLPGISDHYIARIAGFSGREGNIRQYEQLMQVLAEILVLHRVVTYPWRESVSFIPEPGGCNSHKTPDIHLQFTTLTVGIEVKSPSFLRHETSYSRSCFSPQYTVIKPIENYLISASDKFVNYKKENANYLSILYVVWDNNTEDPLAALIHPRHGIFSHVPSPYPCVDAVILSQHRAHFEALINNTISPLPLNHLLDYGLESMEPHKRIILNPASRVTIPPKIAECFDAI